MESNVTTDQIRELTGFGNAQVNDSTITGLIDQAENTLRSRYGLVAKPKTVTENKTTHILDTGIQLRNVPVQRIQGLRDGDETVAAKNISIYNRSSGVLRFKDNAATLVNNPDFEYDNLRIIYDYGTIETTFDQVKADEPSEITAGDNVTIQTLSELNVSTGDFVEIFSLQSPSERTKVTSQTPTSIKVDTLIYNHASDATITKLDTAPSMNSLVKITAAVNTVLREASGKTNETQNYNLGDLSVAEKNQEFQSTLTPLLERQQQLLQELTPNTVT